MPEQRVKATRPFHKRIVVVFDFDRTLSDGTIDALLDELGVEDKAGWRRDKLGGMLDDGWDEILAKSVLLARAAKDCGREITEDLVKEVGRRLPAYPGIEETAARLHEIGREIAGAEVELYVLSSGFVDMMTVSPIAHLFDDIWGSSMHWEDGRLVGVKRSLIHSSKARYLMALAKGLGLAGANAPAHVYQDRPPGEWHVPFDQMIYVGHGASDIAAFKLIQENGGIGLAVDHSEDEEQWEAAEHIYRSARVENLAPPGFSEGAELRRSLELATKIIANRVALRALAQGK